MEHYAMEKLTIDVQKVTACYFEFKIFLDGVYIGEYERSKEQDVDRKKREILNAKDYLIKVFHERKDQPFSVRWDGIKRTKVIKINDKEVATIPKEFWEKPSWQR